MYESPLIQFGRRLIFLRKQKGWSQEQLAIRSGLARSYVGGIERGERNLSLINICVLADTLQLSPPTLLEFSLEVNMAPRKDNHPAKTPE